MKLLNQTILVSQLLLYNVVFVRKFILFLD